MLPGQILVLFCGTQLAVAGLRGHKQGLLKAQALGSQRSHEGLQQRLWIALLHAEPNYIRLQPLCSMVPAFTNFSQWQTPLTVVHI